MDVLKKGKRFEAEVARLLTEKTRLKWQRVPQSGAHATQHNTIGMRGDVYCESKTVVIECKAYDKLTINELFSQKSKLYRWIKQCREESKELPWLLFIKINNAGTYLLYEKSGQKEVDDLNLLKEGHTEIMINYWYRLIKVEA